VVESFFAIMLLCLIFWGFLQAALLYNHERVLQFASFAAARSASVGFQQEIYTRAYRVASIPASGAMREPVSTWSGANQQYQQLGVEQPIIPLYLGLAPTGNMDYDYWDRYNMRPSVIASATAITEQHDQFHPIEMPIISYILYGQTNATITMMGNISTSMAAHYPYYMQ
jgi:hypothetical protein